MCNHLTPKQMARAFTLATVPTCRRCGSTDISAEPVAARWYAEAQEWQVTDICDKGHHCDSCDDETRIEWRIVI
jgi:hypothetical protein